MDVYKDNILDGMIYTFHFQHFPAAAAHLMLTQMIGSQACTLQYVQGIYKRIEDKKFSLTKPHLLDMPDHILENVVKELDEESRTIVRKTCKKLRALADNHPRRLEKLNVYFNETKKSVSLHFNGLAVHYIKKEGGCLVEFSLSHRFSATKSIMKRSKFIEGEMKQLATQDLKTILINPKLEIGELEIEKEDGREFYPEFKEFAEMLPTLDHKLHIEHFNWRKLLENKNLNQIIMYDNHGYYPVQKLRDILSPFQSHSDPGWAEFNYPNSNKKLMIRVYPHTIWFKGPCFKPHEERDGMMDFEDDDEEDWSDSEDESEEEVTDEEETSEEESDVEESDADDN
ncbi:hypothetical protein CAEBREN_08762 [Caenorhabditis brenneri]|uniref:F-box domain-containing protein n=1 Tax=Caenorhabditis brenneri TaxID=135651 RepID=G0N895_CAEBE|nr:hypothetical protein CAEBREN_08762 [Caenorhabditis brenneri]